MRMDFIFVLLLALSSCVNARIYYFIPNNVRWTEAQTYCRQHYTDLAAAGDQMDYDELLKTVPDGFSDYFWIGLYRTDASAPWVWSDQSNSALSLWAPLQPNNMGGLQFCVGVYSNAEWNDLECTMEKAFVCYAVKKRTRVRLEVKSSQQVNDPAVKTEIQQQIEKILKERGLTEDAKFLWKTQPDGNVFQKKKEEKKKSDNVTQQTCL